MSTNSQKLSGKVAIVTGASKGIGAAIATHLAAAGASVVVNYSSSKEGADRIVDLIAKRGGRAVAVQADVSQQADIDRLFAATETAFGRLDILVNNAGVFDFAPLENITAEPSIGSSTSTFSACFSPRRKRRNRFAPAAGSIINISSEAALKPIAGGAVYSATKAAVDAVTKSLAAELGPRKIRVNSLNPGMVETEGFHSAGFAGSEFQKTVEANTALGRIGQPDDIGPVAVFLASEDSRWITGQTHLVSGGYR